MRRRAATNRIKTVALTDPQPEFVSLVKAGANGTPWLAVKDDESGPALKVDRVGLGTRGYEVVGVSFAKTEKWTKESATEWLNSGGYEGYVLEETDEAVVAKSEAGIPEGARVVEMDGLKVTIAKTEAAQKAEAKPEEGGDVNPGADSGHKDAPAAKADAGKRDEPTHELRKKFYAYAAWDSEKAPTLGEALAAGNDGVPPGYDDIETAFRITLFRAMREGDEALVRAVATEFGEVIVKMAAAWNGFVGRSKADAESNFDRWMRGKTEDEKMTVKQDAPAEPAAKTEEPKPAEAPAEAQKGGTDPTKEQAPAEAEQPKETAKEEAPKEPSLAEQIAAAVGVAVKAALDAAMAPIAAKVEEVAQKADATKTEVEQRVASLEAEGPARKSAEVEETAPADSKKTDDAEARYAERALRGAFGISGGVSAFAQRKR